MLYVFQRLTEILEHERARAAKQWDDPRLVWLPLQYALLPEQYNSQEEIDARHPRWAVPPGVWEIGISMFASADRGRGYGR